ncbi:hypothetical protein [Methylosinus sp. PW1]|uniref:hypothetical protein n=1 Tax=Methylosinus sp. PW1 TaxID=107636 RepID=UPI00055FB13C|nr:hypothetical protein [Methylosinus sp. PW1]
MRLTSDELIDAIAREIEPLAFSFREPDDSERHRMLSARMTAKQILGIVVAQDVEPGLYWATHKGEDEAAVVNVDDRGRVNTIGRTFSGYVFNYDVGERIVMPAMEGKKAT